MLVCRLSVMRMKTGVEGLDELVEGFPRGSLIVVEGAPGTGKTALAACFIYNGAVRYGEPGIYASLIEEEDAFYEYMRGFGYDFEPLRERGLFRYLALPTLLEPGVAPSMNMVVELVESAGAKRLVIDSYTALSQMFRSQAEARAFLHTALSRIVRRLGCTTLLIREEPSAEKREYGFEEYVADGIIHLRYGRLEDKLIRELSVLKLRGSEVRLPDACFTLHGGFRVLVCRGASRSGRGAGFKPLDDPPGKYSTGIPDLDREIGGYSRGSSVMLELDSKLALEDYMLALKPTIVNYVKKGRPCIGIPSGGTAWLDIANALREWGLSEEELQRYCRILDAPEPWVKRPKYVAEIEPEDYQASFNEFMRLYEDLRREHGHPPIVVAGADSLAHYFGEKTIGLFLRGTGILREMGGLAIWLVKRTYPWLVERLAPLVDVHLRIIRRHGCLLLYGVKPRTPLYAIQPDPSGESLAPKLIPIA